MQLVVPEQDVQEMLTQDGQVALVLKHALANGAINVLRRYGQGSKSWCLIELAGTVCLAYGLTLQERRFS